MYLSAPILFAVFTIEFGAAAPNDVHIHLHGIGTAAEPGKVNLSLKQCMQTRSHLAKEKYLCTQ